MNVTRATPNILKVIKEIDQPEYNKVIESLFDIKTAVSHYLEYSRMVAMESQRLLPKFTCYKAYVYIFFRLADGFLLDIWFLLPISIA